MRLRLPGSSAHRLEGQTLPAPTTSCPNDSVTRSTRTPIPTHSTSLIPLITTEQNAQLKRSCAPVADLVIHGSAVRAETKDPHQRDHTAAIATVATRRSMDHGDCEGDRWPRSWDRVAPDALAAEKDPAVLLVVAALERWHTGALQHLLTSSDATFSARMPQRVGGPGAGPPTSAAPPRGPGPASPRSARAGIASAAAPPPGDGHPREREHDGEQAEPGGRRPAAERFPQELEHVRCNDHLLPLLDQAGEFRRSQRMASAGPASRVLGRVRHSWTPLASGLASLPGLYSLASRAW